MEGCGQQVERTSKIRTIDDVELRSNNQVTVECIMDSNKSLYVSYSLNWSKISKIGQNTSRFVACVVKRNI